MQEKLLSIYIIFRADVIAVQAMRCLVKSVIFLVSILVVLCAALLFFS